MQIRPINSHNKVWAFTVEALHNGHAYWGHKKEAVIERLKTSSHVSGYFWIGNFYFPDTASVHTYLVHPAYESPLQNGKCLNSLWIRNRVDAKSRFFFIRWRNKVESSSLLWIMYSRWKHRSQVLSRQSKMQISRSLRRMLSCQYSQRRPGYKS